MQKCTKELAKHSSDICTVVFKTHLVSTVVILMLLCTKRRLEKHGSNICSSGQNAVIKHSNEVVS